MTNIEKYINAFTEALEVKEDQVEGLEWTRRISLISAPMKREKKSYPIITGWRFKKRDIRGAEHVETGGIHG